MRRFLLSAAVGSLLLASAFLAQLPHGSKVKYHGPLLTPAVATVMVAADSSKRKRGGGNFFAFKQVKRNADGTFVPYVGSDCFGDSAGTWHVLGSHTDTGWARDDKGADSLDITLVEMDVPHRNLMKMVSPITAQSLIKDPDLTLEDGTQVINAEVSGNVTFNYFEAWYLDAPVGGKAQAFVCIGQFAPTAGYSNKITEWSLNKVKFMSVDAQGYTCPALPTPTAFSTFSVPTLAAPYQQGIHISGT